MNSSDDGTVWTTKVILGSEGVNPRFGPAIAADRNLKVALAYIYESEALRQDVLVVKENYFAHQWWNSDSPDWQSMPIEAASAPTMCHIRDSIYALAWNDGGKVKTTTVNMAITRQDSFTGSQLIRGASGISGPPSITFNGQEATLVWLASSKDKICRATGSPQQDTVRWGSTTCSSLPAGCGIPNIAWDGSKYLMATSGTFSTGSNPPLVNSWVRVFESDDATSWARVANCIYVNPFLRKCALASARRSMSHRQLEV